MTERRSYFVERLTLRAWFGAILPRVVRERARGPADCLVIDASRAAIGIARATGRIGRASVQRFDFRLLDVRDGDGALASVGVLFADLPRAQADALAEIGEVSGGPRFREYLAKSLVEVSIEDAGSLWRPLLVLRVCAWRARGGALVFLSRRPWPGAIARTARMLGLECAFVSQQWTFRRALVRVAGPAGMQMLREVRARLHRRSSRPAQRNVPTRVDRAGWAVAVEHRGQMNLDRPDRLSDVFFWQQSDLPGNRLVLLFGWPQDPLDERKARELASHGITPIAIHPRATTLEKAPIFVRRERPPRVARAAHPSRWVRDRMEEYAVARAWWRALFESQGVRVFVSWYKSQPQQAAIADALADLGGIAVSYQRSFEGLPSVETATVADVAFGFAPGGADIERLSGASLRWYVATGYLGDHRFPLLRAEAAEVRRSLRDRGAERVLSFFDENSHDLDRWILGHTVTRTNYEFLLSKVLDEPELGLVLKPKVPRTLRQRLGPVGELLDRARATGRCVVFEEGTTHGSAPPAVAAMASDVAIHGHLIAATAAMEAALTGTPTVLLDLEGCPYSALYRLGEGKVVFRDWDSLWAALGDRWEGGTMVGDWSPLLEEIDPFRDGRAAERMGSFVGWLLDGLSRGEDRETVMDAAAARYAEMWGETNVVRLDRAAVGATT